jgi:hypothetical protein
LKVWKTAVRVVGERRIQWREALEKIFVKLTLLLLSLLGWKGGGREEGKVGVVASAPEKVQFGGRLGRDRAEEIMEGELSMPWMWPVEWRRWARSMVKRPSTGEG